MNEDVRVTTRIPKKINEWLKAKARQQNRSANGQLIEFLESLMRAESERA